MNSVERIALAIRNKLAPLIALKVDGRRSRATFTYTTSDAPASTVRVTVIVEEVTP